MAIPTTCQTPGAIFHTSIQPNCVSVTIELPFKLQLTEEEAFVLETNLHNMTELVLAQYFNK